MTWHTQAEIDQIARDGIATKLSDLISSYDGAPEISKEILRGLAAARSLDMDCRTFEDAFAERHAAFEGEAWEPPGPRSE